MNIFPYIIGFGFVIILVYNRILYKEVNDKKKSILIDLQNIIYEILNIDESHTNQDSFIKQFKDKIDNNGINLKFVDKQLIKKQTILNFLALNFTIALLIYFAILYCPQIKEYFQLTQTECNNKVSNYLIIYIIILIVATFYYLRSGFHKLNFLLTK
ncbi:MAG: hypothetical protein K8S16_18195 [Bacteroidales bacterium]|nr:hypothetical protein [Bacteroidales bacterium]